MPDGTTASPESARAPHDPNLRFDRIAITSVFGDPRHPRTWSGAPNNTATALEKLGVEVHGVHPRLRRPEMVVIAGCNLVAGYGRPHDGEAFHRTAAARRARAWKLARRMRTLGVADVLHTGTLDLPAVEDDGSVRHYLYCDHSWNLSRRYRLDALRFDEREIARFEELERAAYHQMTHIFTFGEFVRRDLVDHYGVPAERVTTVGSGMGAIEPYEGPKDYANGQLLFVAKHLFEAKGGPLVIEAFRLIARRAPHTRLTVVGSARPSWLADLPPNVEFLPYVPWRQLESLFRESSLLVQPMINDPWGQVYLEALTSRTPVVGLNRNGLPEIVGGGRFGFLIDAPLAESLAATVLEALADPDRLASMGAAGQKHVLENFSWDRVAKRIAFVGPKLHQQPRHAS